MAGEDFLMLRDAPGGGRLRHGRGRGEEISDLTQSSRRSRAREDGSEPPPRAAGKWDGGERVPGALRAGAGVLFFGLSEIVQKP